MLKFTFPRRLRLLTAACFTFVFQEPQQAKAPYIVIFSRKNSLGYPRIGFIIAKKNIRQAHERSRIKRLMRESFRVRQYELPKMDFVVIIKKEVANLDNRTITQALEKLWHYHCRTFRKKS